MFRDTRYGSCENGATTSMTDGATNPTITSGSVLDDVKFINKRPDAFQVGTACTLKMQFLDGSITTMKLPAGAICRFQVKKLFATGGTTGIVAADITLLYDAQLLCGRRYLRAAALQLFPLHAVTLRLLSGKVVTDGCSAHDEGNQ